MTAEMESKRSCIPFTIWPPGVLSFGPPLVLFPRNVFLSGGELLFIHQSPDLRALHRSLLPPCPAFCTLSHLSMAAHLSAKMSMDVHLPRRLSAPEPTIFIFGTSLFP